MQKKLSTCKMSDTLTLSYEKNAHENVGEMHCCSQSQRHFTMGFFANFPLTKNYKHRSKALETLSYENQHTKCW